MDAQMGGSVVVRLPDFPPTRRGRDTGAAGPFSGVSQDWLREPPWVPAGEGPTVPTPRSLLIGVRAGLSEVLSVLTSPWGFCRLSSRLRTDCACPATSDSARFCFMGFRALFVGAYGFRMDALLQVGPRVKLRTLVIAAMRSLNQRPWPHRCTFPALARLPSTALRGSGVSKQHQLISSPTGCAWSWDARSLRSVTTCCLAPGSHSLRASRHPFPASFGSIT